MCIRDRNLIRVKEKEICKNVQELLLDGEQIVGAYKTVRDQAVFTSHRIFIVDMQGVTGTRQEIFVPVSYTHLAKMMAFLFNSRSGKVCRC